METKRKKIENGVCKDAERQRVRGLERPSIFKPRLSDGPSYEGFMPSTGLKTRGYLTSRLSDGYFPTNIQNRVNSNSRLSNDYFPLIIKTYVLILSNE